MSNDDGKNFTMKIHIFLIILDFIQICVSIETNISIDNDLTDPITLLRGKRQLTEYTRWQSNLVTKQEFIVKVDDDNFNPTTATPPNIVGINIQPVTKTGEKIIISGAMVPQVKTTAFDMDTSVEYTRFVAPTTVRATNMDDMPYPQIKAIQGLIPPFASSKYTTRDEFRLTPALARQYAPITPVAFYPRASLLVPTTVSQRPDLYPSRSPSSPAAQQTRTKFELQDLNTPMLTTLADAQDLESFFITLDTDESKGTRTISPGFMTSLRAWDEDDEATTAKKTTNIDVDPYHMMFYNDEDNEIDDSKNKKDLESLVDGEDGNKDNQNQNDESEEETNGLGIDMKGSNLRNEDLKSRNGLGIDMKGSNLRNEDLNSRKSYMEKCLNATAELSHIQEDPQKTKTRMQRHQMCSLLKFRQLSFDSPRTLPEIVTQLKQWAERSPIAKAVDITANNFTTMDNPIYMMIVDDPSSGQVVSAKDIVMIVAGIQGRDHHAVTAAMYVLYQLIQRTEAHTDLLTKYRFWIIPVFNPDGYDYSLTFPQRREWTKNLHQSWEECNGQKSCKDCETYGLRCTPQPCYGVHLDRNFEYQWIPAEELRAEHPCGDLYAGLRQLSERETRALTTFLHERRTPISMFVAFKEGDVLGVMYPYSHTRKKRAFDHDYRRRASRAASAAFSISGRPYVAGQTSEFLPLYAGGMEDWVDGHLGIDNTYTIMMFRATDSYNSKLMTEHVVHEAYAALDTLLLETGNTLGAEAQKLQIRAQAAKTSPVHSSLLVLALTIPVLNS